VIFITAFQCSLGGGGAAGGSGGGGGDFSFPDTQPILGPPCQSLNRDRGHSRHYHDEQPSWAAQKEAPTPSVVPVCRVVLLLGRNINMDLSISYFYSRPTRTPSSIFYQFSRPPPIPPQKPTKARRFVIGHANFDSAAYDTSKASRLHSHLCSSATTQLVQQFLKQRHFAKDCDLQSRAAALLAIQLPLSEKRLDKSYFLKKAR